MAEGYFVIRTYEAGAVGEKTKFFVPGKRPEKGKLSRRQRNAVRKQEQTEYSAQKNLARILNANFSSGDLLMGLDYSDEGLKRLNKWIENQGICLENMPEEEKQNILWEAAAHELDNALRRVKRKLAKQGMELKAVYCTSDMDGDTGELVRVHHHLVVNAGVQDAFQLSWEKYGLGGVSWTPLWDNQIDRTPIAEYIIRQVRRIPDAKKFRSTRNLVRPVPKNRIVYTDNELQVPKGGKLIFRQEYENRYGVYSDLNRKPQYIRYMIPQRKKAPPEKAPEIA